MQTKPLLLRLRGGLAMHWVSEWRRLRWLRRMRWLAIALLSVGLTLWLGASHAPALATRPPIPVAADSAISSPHLTQQNAQQNAPQNLQQNGLSQGRSLYEAGRYGEAIAILEQVAQAYQRQGDARQEAIARSNLSLVYQRVGQWPQAEAAIARSLSLLSAVNGDMPSLVRAQTLDVQGQLQFAQGNAEAALTTWEQAAADYAALGDSSGLSRSRIRQAEALQALGLYRRAVTVLSALADDLRTQPDALTTVVALRRLGDALRAIANLPASTAALQQSLAMAERLQQPEAIATATLSLGNTAASGQDFDGAIAFFEQAATLSSSPAIQAQARLNHLRLLVARANAAAETPSAATPSSSDYSAYTSVYAEAIAQLAQIPPLLDRIPPGRTALRSRINFAHSLTQLSALSAANESAGQPFSPWLTPTAIEQQLTAALQQAQAQQDPDSESYAAGVLGTLYAQTNQLDKAQQQTERALQLAQRVNTPELLYQWAWQLGRIAQQQGDRAKAIASYSSAIENVQRVRRDLAAVSLDAQFSFRNSVEPVYRELVSLLLQPGLSPTEAELEQARFTIEALQLAELDNFFREACLNAREVKIDDIDRQAGVIYPIILPDRLEVIFSMPDRPLQRYTTQIAATEVQRTLRNLAGFLKQRTANHRVKPQAQIVYNWLIQPIRAELEQSSIKTLVFVLDGALRSVPMSVLYDGESYLIERYSIALTPGLQLLEGSSLRDRPLEVLLGGVSEPNLGAAPLPGVLDEISKIQAALPGRVLLNQSFTSDALHDAVNATAYPIVHLATHGFFSSNLDDTYILTWGDRLTLNEFNDLIKTSDINRRRPIELLVLSACVTAVEDGDGRALLGLAGMAVRAGARSTIASLWQANDVATAQLMTQFYSELAANPVTKAEALRRAQVASIQSPDFNQPFFWSLFVLVGNWL